MPLLLDAPLTSFAGATQLQANGVVDTPEALPTGIDGRLDIVLDPLGLQGMVMRATVYDTDADTAGSATGLRKRAEVRYENQAFGEYWYSWKTLIMPGDWQSAQPFTFAQHHTQSSDSVYQPYWLCRQGTALRIDRAIGLPDTPARQSNWIMGMPEGRWVDLCVHVRWSSGDAGYIEMFIDGVRQFFHVVPTSYDEANAGYFKLGLYNGLQVATPGWGYLRAYYSQLRIWEGAATYLQGVGRELTAAPRAVFATARK
jgi:hypothetical protein